MTPEPPSSELLNRSPLQVRKDLPVFVDKSPSDVQSDRYERYWEVVVRQLLWHYSKELNYPDGFAPIFSFIFSFLEGKNFERILEIGGGTGRLAGELALKLPETQVYMIDYAYNMLRSARDLWIDGRDIVLDGGRLGMKQTTLKGRQLFNLWLGQARGEDLPFKADVFDMVLSSFFIDRAADLGEAVREQWRVLRFGGYLIAVSPLNFQSRKQWEKYGSAEKITAFFLESGFRLIKFEPEMICEERLDGRGNAILWKTAGWILQKTNLPKI